jgi:type I restriction enzyme, S subunit
MRSVQLGKHAKLIRGITFKPADKCDPNDDGAVVCMRTKNVQATLDDSDLIAIPITLVKNPEKMLTTGDILVSSANSWNLVGKCCQVRELKYPSTAGGFISIMRPKTEELDSTYLYRWFSSDEIQRKARSFGNQTTNISNLNHKRTLTLQIPLPPLAEQKRIAGILDAADALRAKRRESLAQLDALLQSTFLDMFGDPVTNPMGWKVGELLGEVSEIVAGLTKGRKLKGNATREVPYLAVVNVQDRHLVLNPLKRIHATESEIQKYRLQDNDLLLTEGGDPDKLGRGTLWHNEVDGCIHQNHIYRVRLHTDKVQPVYLSWLVGSDRGKRYFLRQAKQTTGIATINLTQLRKFPLLNPPLGLQHHFATIVKSVEQQKTRQRTHLAELNTLFASLQQRAFNGEL